MTDHATPAILVTGSHRSGTTWVGRLLAESPDIGYIHEPFNLGTSGGVCRAPIERWFTFVTDANARDYEAALRDTLRFRYSAGSALAGARSLADVRDRWYELRRFLRYRLRRSRPLMKDPIALLSAEWLARRFGMRVVVMIRHPAAFASSLKRLHWTYPFDHLLEQPLLMRGRLARFRERIRWFVEEERDILDQAAMLWTILYSVVQGYRRDHPDWMFVRLEDLARAPVAGFRGIFEYVGLPFTPTAEARVRETSEGGVDASPYSPHSITRDSKASVRRWRRELRPDEIDRVREWAEPVARDFYAEDEWG